MEDHKNYLEIFPLLNNVISDKLITNLVYNKIISTPSAWEWLQEDIQDAIKRGKGEESKEIFIMADSLRGCEIYGAELTIRNNVKPRTDEMSQAERESNGNLETFLYHLIYSIDLHDLSQKLLLHFKELQNRKSKKKSQLKAA
jgi:hypothetical protein